MIRNTRMLLPLQFHLAHVKLCMDVSISSTAAGGEGARTCSRGSFVQIELAHKYLAPPSKK